MSTVTGTVELEFEDGTILGQTHTWTADLTASDAIGTLLTVWEAVQPQLAPLVELWGPLADLSWTVDVEPDLVALPASLGLLATAVAVLALARR